MTTVRPIRRRTLGLALGVAVAATSGVAAIAGATVNPTLRTTPIGSRGLVPVDTTAAWPALTSIALGRGVPGSTSHGVTTFHVGTAGTISATMSDPAFHVSGITTYRSEADVVDLSELPPGAKRPAPVTTWHVDQQTTGATVAVDAGERVAVAVDAAVAPGSPDTLTGTVDIGLGGTVVHVPLALNVADVTPTLGERAVTVIQGRSAAIPVAVRSNAGPDTDVPFVVSGAPTGLAVTTPTVHVGRHGTAAGQIGLAADANLAPGIYHLDVAASAFAGSEQTNLDTIDVTVVPRPTLDLSVDLGVAEQFWNSQRDFLCDRLRDGAGQAVLAGTGRSIRDPQCYLAPAALKAVKVGDQLQLTGTIAGNWLSFYATTPDGIPGALDPKFQVDFDVVVALTIDLPHTLDGTSTLRISAASLDIRNARIDSHNLTGDIVKAVAMLFGEGRYFRAADYGFSNEATALTATVNQALAALDGPIQQAVGATGLTTLDTKVDPTGHLITLHLS